MIELGLDWGIKLSFVQYIAKLPDGQASASSGVRPTETNGLFFEADPDTPPTPAGADAVYAFRGDVRFGGHFGMLYVRIADPWIVRRGNQAELTVLDPHEPKKAPRKRLVTFALSQPRSEGDIQIWDGTDVILTAEACSVFNDVYAAGERFESLVFAVHRGAAEGFGGCASGSGSTGCV
ncbi:HtaA domain-containing protein [Nocardia sp. NPDC005366]|uniref:HtaA domain-containing protein n=1 Tax=Nocardia sp. NPDC005366 TaxID=3156878 RepID=UPI0033AD31A5